MEAQKKQVGGETDGEVRTLHIIYILCRIKGVMEPSHLIEVHSFSRNSVRLRDVKRLLAELPGKDMPESFAWLGYVWQDLLDENIITPLFNSEFVLIGSEIVSNLTGIQEARDDKMYNKEVKNQLRQTKLFDLGEKTHCEIEEETSSLGSETSTSIDDHSMKLKVENEKSDNEEERADKLENQSSCLSLFGKKNNEKSKTNCSKDITLGSSRSSSSDFTRSKKSYSSSGSSMIRNLITCGDVDTKDSTVVLNNLNPKSHWRESIVNSPVNNIPSKNLVNSTIYDFIPTPWDQQSDHNARRSCKGGKISNNDSNGGKLDSQKLVSQSCRPNCSQCGKKFKPEKMYAHMKSCKGMKSVNQDKTPPTPTTNIHSEPMISRDEDSASGFYLTR